MINLFKSKFNKLNEDDKSFLINCLTSDDGLNNLFEDHSNKNLDQLIECIDLFMSLSPDEVKNCLL